MATSYVVFLLDDQRYALRASVVERVVGAVHVTPLSKAPDIVLGVVCMQGRVIPVVNVRRRFRLPERLIALTDQLIVAHTRRRPVALVADRVTGVVECADDDLIPVESIVRSVEYFDGVMTLRDGLVLVHDLDTFLSLEESASMDCSLEAT